MRSLRVGIRWIALLAVTLAVFGGGPAAPSTSPAAASSPPLLQLTNADNGKTFHIVSGQRVEITLTPTARGEKWTVPQSDNPLCVSEIPQLRTPSHTYFEGIFPGTANITAHETPSTPRGKFHVVIVVPL